jgi:hypothetical protein
MDQKLLAMGNSVCLINMSNPVIKSINEKDLATAEFIEMLKKGNEKQL